jgi:hypothetical protein
MGRIAKAAIEVREARLQRGLQSRGSDGESGSQRLHHVGRRVLRAPMR